MAEHDLIAGYLGVLGRSLRWRPDAEDLVAEAEDHLRETTYRLVLAGADPQAAQQHALDRFGEAAPVARSFAMTSSGGIAMPTETTRAAGTAGLVAAGMWVLVAVGGVLSTFFLVTSSLGAYLVWVAAALLAAAASALTLAGALLRSGGLRGWWPGITLFVTVSAVALAGIASWAWPYWGGLLALAALLTVLRLRSGGLSAGSGPAGLDWLLVAAWPVGIGVFSLLGTLRVGLPDEYGDYPVAWVSGLSVGAALFAAGLVRLGRGLRTEWPAELPEPLATA